MGCGGVLMGTVVNAVCFHHRPMVLVVGTCVSLLLWAVLFVAARGIVNGITTE